MVGTWLGEIRSCSCLAVLPDSAWVLLNKIYQPFLTSLYWQSFSFIHFVTTLWKMEGPACFCVVHAAVAFSWGEGRKETELRLETAATEKHFVFFIQGGIKVVPRLRESRLLAPSGRRGRVHAT